MVHYVLDTPKSKINQIAFIDFLKFYLPIFIYEFVLHLNFLDFSFNIIKK